MIVITPAILLKEQLIGEEIFRKYTDYHLNSSNYGLIGKDKYLGGSMHLDCLVTLLKAYRCDAGNNCFIGPVAVETFDVVKVIDSIHHYESEEISVMIAGSGQGESGASAGIVSKYIEVPSGGQTVHNISIELDYILKQVFLNGVLLSKNDWTYAGNTFTYIGEEVLDSADWFLLHFEK